MPESQTVEAIRHKKLALMHGVMLLTGYCFENLFKGLAASRKLKIKEVCKAHGRPRYLNLRARTSRPIDRRKMVP